MKNILLIIPCVVLGLTAHCQSLSVKDVEAVLHRNNAKELLTSRSFSLVGLDIQGLQTFIKNSKSSNEEKVYIAGSSVTYSTKNKTYMANLLKQLRGQFHLMVSDDNADYSYYQFADQNSRVSINMPKVPGIFSTMTARTK